MEKIDLHYINLDHRTDRNELMIKNWEGKVKPHENLSLESMYGEIWKDIFGYEGYYQISNFGRVKSFSYKKNRILVCSISRTGYIKYKLSKNGILKYFSCHRLVALSFIINEENKPQINHKNGIKTDNSVDNLEWCTASQNTLHSFKTGLNIPTKGEKNGYSKLKDCDIPIIKKLCNDGNKYEDIAKIYGVHKMQISRINRGKTWKHIN